MLKRIKDNAIDEFQRADTQKPQIVINCYEENDYSILEIIDNAGGIKDEILKEIFNEEKDRFDNLEDIAQTLGHAIKRDRAKQQQFMAFLIQLAFIDGEVSKSEDEVLVTIDEALEFDPNDYHAIFDQFEKMMKNVQPKANIGDAYKLLGVNSSDDLTTIKKAYRKLVREYHPDII